jgi:HD-like signal output (HDOD) protein
MKRLLFVDDEPKLLDGLRRMLHSMRKEWDMEFASSGAQGLDLLTQRPFDVVISDMRMPGMDGAQFLNEVRNRHPHIIRFILSGQTERSTLVGSVGTFHQFLSKPCEQSVLKAAIERACDLKNLLADDSLRGLVGRMRTIPTLPSVYLELKAALQCPDTSVQKVAQTIAQDAGLTATILQVANSAFFGLRARPITNPVQAVSFLGIETVQAMALTAQVFSQLSIPASATFSIDRLWRHSLRTAACAKAITVEEAVAQSTVDDVFLCSILHDIGMLALVANLPERYERTCRTAHARGLPLWEAEREEFGASHAEVGAYLIGLWGFGDSIVEAIAYHHTPSQSKTRALGPLAILHVASVLSRATEESGQNGASGSPDTAFFDEAGLSERIERWRTIIHQTLTKESSDE